MRRILGQWRAAHFWTMEGAAIKFDNMTDEQKVADILRRKKSILAQIKREQSEGEGVLNWTRQAFLTHPGSHLPDADEELDEE